MYSSKEIRWFTPNKSEQIEKWFADKRQTFETTKPRTDFYLPIPNKDDISFKLREGNIEMKLRQNKSDLVSLSVNTHGYYENWVRWSFNVCQSDQLSKSIIQERKYTWIEVYKERMGVKLTEDSNKSLSIIDISERVPYGCQIEYTRLVIDGKEWFTFATEWFGDKFLELDSKLLDEITGITNLDAKYSMGYNEFLNKL